MPIAEELVAGADKNVLTMHEKAWYHIYRVTLERLKIRLLKAHCRRDTSATALAEVSVSPAIITAILGHEDCSTTLGYTHILLEEKIGTANAQYISSSSTEQ